jgi:hypothetical protein
MATAASGALIGPLLDRWIPNSSLNLAKGIAQSQMSALAPEIIRAAIFEIIGN